MHELPAQRSAKPLGSASTNKATVCETVVSAVGDYFRVVARNPAITRAIWGVQYASRGALAESVWSLALLPLFEPC